MERFEDFSALKLPSGCVLTIGNFDGVHLGHQSIFKHLVNRSRQLELPSVVLTFEPHPATILFPNRVPPPRLTTQAEKARKIESAGIDVLIEYATNKTLLNLSAEKFFQDIVVATLNAKAIVEGTNFFFGANRSGDIDLLRQLGEKSGRFLTTVPPVIKNEHVVSSSLIRQQLKSGDISQANQLLGRPYLLSGTVHPGAQRGRTLGFPTANLHHVETLLPAEGVYAAWCHLPEGKFATALSLGPNPTFAEMELKVEAHLIGFTGDLYGKTITLELIDHLRPMCRFNSLAELEHQIRQDVARVRGICQVG